MLPVHGRGVNARGAPGSHGEQTKSRHAHSKMATARIGLAVPPRMRKGKPIKRKRRRPMSLSSMRGSSPPFLQRESCEASASFQIGSTVFGPALKRALDMQVARQCVGKGEIGIARDGLP